MAKVIKVENGLVVAREERRRIGKKKVVIKEQEDGSLW